MSIAIAVAVAVSVSVSVGGAVAILVCHTVCLAVGVLAARIRVILPVADRQVALHVVLGRRERAVHLAEQAIVRVLALGGAARSFRASILVGIRWGCEDVRLHAILAHGAWGRGREVLGAEQITASTARWLQNFARGLGVLSESDREVGGGHVDAVQIGRTSSRKQKHRKLHVYFPEKQTLSIAPIKTGSIEDSPLRFYTFRLQKKTRPNVYLRALCEGVYVH